MSEPLPIGSKAPAFEAPASDGRTYALADLIKNGSVALVFIPATTHPAETANSPPCAMRSPSSMPRACSRSE